MKPIMVEITKEALQKHASCDTFDALAQIIFNAIDSEANIVKVNFQYEECGLPDEFEGRVIKEITVEDNGRGIPFEKVEEYFKQYNNLKVG